MIDIAEGADSEKFIAMSMALLKVIDDCVSFSILIVLDIDEKDMMMFGFFMDLDFDMIRIEGVVRLKRTGLKIRFLDEFWKV